MSTNLAQRADIRIVDEIDSTSHALMRLAHEGETGPLWLVARRQTAGRGRRARAWVAPEGNFAGSLLIQRDEPPRILALRSFLAALAVRDALVACGVPAHQVSLKWPNDVLFDTRKLAGILLETAPGGRLVTGIGVNLAGAPDASQIETRAVTPVALSESMIAPPSIETFLGHLVETHDHWDRRFVSSGFDPIRMAWLDSAAGLGRMITARMGQRSLTGQFETIAPDGALVLATAHAREHISAAELHFS